MDLTETTKKDLIRVAMNACFLRKQSFFNDLSSEKIEWNLQRRIEVIIFDFFMVFTALYVALGKVIEKEEVISSFRDMFKLQILELFGDEGLKYVEENLAKRIKSYKEQMITNEGRGIYYFLAKEFIKNLYGGEIDESKDLKITMGVNKIFQLDYQDTINMFNKIILENFVICSRCGIDAKFSGPTARRRIDGQDPISVDEELYIECDNCGRYLLR